jgi:hypothetical protein
VVEANDRHVDLGGLFWRNAEESAAATAADSTTAAATKSAADTLLSTATGSTAAESATPSPTTAEASADLGQHGHTGKGGWHLDVERLLRLIRHEHAGKPVALGNERGIEPTVSDGLKKLNRRRRRLGGRIATCGVRRIREAWRYRSREKNRARHKPEIAHHHFHLRKNPSAGGAAIRRPQLLA